MKRLSLYDKYFLQRKYEDIMPRNAINIFLAKKNNFEMIEWSFAEKLREKK